MQAGGRDGEDLDPIVGNADHVLELGGERAVPGHGGPAIVQDLHLRPADIHHRLDGEEHAGAQHRAFAGAAEMQDVRRLVEAPADAVAAEVADYGEPVPLHEDLDRMADIAERRAGPDRRDATHEGFVGHVHQQPRLGRGPARHVHAAGVAMPAVEDDGDVDVDDVAIGQDALAGDAVADDMVDRDAGRPGVAAIAERRRHRVVGDHELVDGPVEMIGRDAGLHMRRDHVQRLGSETPGAPHPLEILGAVYGDPAGFAALLLHGVCAVRWKC